MSAASIFPTVTNNAPGHPTPFLFMDLAIVAQRYQAFRSALPRADVHYAMKCNPDPTLLMHIRGLGASFEVASFPELQTLIDLGVDARDVLFSNPVKIERHVARAAHAGLFRFAFDSEEELDKIARHAPGASVYVRLAVDAGASRVPSEGKFGVDADTAFRLMTRVPAMGLVPYGVTFHVGSQMERPEVWLQAVRRCGQLMRRLATAGVRLSMVDIGGGFPAHYRSLVPEIGDIGDVIETALRAELPYQPAKIAVEPGRGLVADAGIMVATVIGLASRATKRWAHLDVGAFNGLIEALETDNALCFPVLDSRGSASLSSYNLTGPSCDSQDTILFDCLLSSDLAVGDRVYVGTAGAYTTSYASAFCGFAIPRSYYHSPSGA